MHEINFQVIGKRIREVRTSKGITQEYVANAADVNTSHISNIENNRVKVSLSTLVSIGNALEVTVDYLLASEYNDSASALDKEILLELQNCDSHTKERILKIIKVLL